jgi:hypothetical protein
MCCLSLAPVGRADFLLDSCRHCHCHALDNEVTASQKADAVKFYICAIQHTQGGFMLCRPSLTAFAALVAVVHEGDWGDKGWKSSGIGYFFGGPTIQA